MILGLPRALQRLLVGGQAELRRPQRPLPQFTYAPELVAAARANPQLRRNYTAGAFAVDEEPVRDPAIEVQPVDPAIAAALAAELQALSVGADAPAVTSDAAVPSRPGVPDHSGARRAGARG